MRMLGMAPRQVEGQLSDRLSLRIGTAPMLAVDPAESGRHRWREVFVMDGEVLDLQLVYDDADDSDEVLDLSSELRQTLLELDVKSVDAVPTEAPERAMGLAEVLGALVVAVGAAERLVRVLKTVGAWVRRTGRTVEIRDGDVVLKLTNVSAELQNRAIDAWLERRGQGG